MSLEQHQWSRRRVLGLGAAVSAGALLAGCSLSAGSSADHSAEPDVKGDWAGSLLDPPFEKPDYTFTDFNGDPFPFREKTDGRLTVLFFGYTNCPDICPVFLNTIARAIEAIGSGPGSRPQVLFVGVDVKRDTLAVMKKYLGNIDPSFIGLSGSGATKAQIEAMIVNALSDLKEAAPVIGEPDDNGDYVVGHPAAAYVFSPDNQAHRRYRSADVRQQEWVRDLPRLDEGTFK